ncbi:methyltransferase [Streptococcus anginosus]|uniref:Methyltransferase n=2 Tax=Streptococcus anginosus TaxID=1328 RepID=A0A4V0AET9_STRAP|nr:methyltransferase [Streptococcus anginosus]VTS50481.1 methyltransferase [Streptococcus anginosus]
MKAKTVIPKYVAEWIEHCKGNGLTITQLSGYDSELYNNKLTKWHRLEFSATAEKGLKRTEVLWLNYQPQTQIELF